jgi:lipoprotein-releasing system ATP-binding protein
MSDLALELIGLKRSFTQGEVTIDVLRGVDAHLKRGEIVALLGPSGSGKSTMLQAVGLLEGGFDGTIRIDGADVTQYEQGERTKTRREKIGFVYQFHHLLPDFNAIENVVLPQLIRGAGQGEAEERAADLLGRLGLGERLHHKPSKLSGGEQQRARHRDTLLVLADEPTGNLDEATADRVFDQFVSLVRDHGSAALVATHNERLATRMDRVLRLHEGRIETSA